MTEGIVTTMLYTFLLDFALSILGGTVHIGKARIYKAILAHHSPGETSNHTRVVVGFLIVSFIK